MFNQFRNHHIINAQFAKRINDVAGLDVHSFALNRMNLPFSVNVARDIGRPVHNSRHTPSGYTLFVQDNVNAILNNTNLTGAQKRAELAFFMAKMRFAIANNLVTVSGSDTTKNTAFFRKPGTHTI